jgi:hypothetical protein
VVWGRGGQTALIAADPVVFTKSLRVIPSDIAPPWEAVVADGLGQSLL